MSTNDAPRRLEDDGIGRPERLRPADCLSDRKSGRHGRQQCHHSTQASPEDAAHCEGFEPLPALRCGALARYVTDAWA